MLVFFFLCFQVLSWHCLKAERGEDSAGECLSVINIKMIVLFLWFPSYQKSVFVSFSLTDHIIPARVILSLSIHTLFVEYYHFNWGPYVLNLHILYVMMQWWCQCEMCACSINSWIKKKKEMAKNFWADCGKVGWN